MVATRLLDAGYKNKFSAPLKVMEVHMMYTRHMTETYPVKGYNFVFSIKLSICVPAYTCQMYSTVVKKNSSGIVHLFQG